MGVSAGRSARGARRCVRRLPTAFYASSARRAGVGSLPWCRGPRCRCRRHRIPVRHCCGWCEWGGGQQGWRGGTGTSPFPHPPPPPPPSPACCCCWLCRACSGGAPASPAARRSSLMSRRGVRCYPPWAGRRPRWCEHGGRGCTVGVPNGAQMFCPCCSRVFCVKRAPHISACVRTFYGVWCWASCVIVATFCQNSSRRCRFGSLFPRGVRV